MLIRIPRRSRRHLLALLSVLASIATAAVPSLAAVEDLPKGHRILVRRGLQVQGMVTRDDVFNLDRYRAANYSSINWLWESNPALQGPAPGFPWARWVGDETKMPPTPAERPYLPSLVALQLGDEWNLNDAAVRNRAVNWFNAIRSQWPDTILYMNNFGGQVNDAALADFVTRARPDMLSFDTYPFKSDYTTRRPSEPAHGSPTPWYSELRRYRVHALQAGVPLAVYRQTFHAVQDYDRTVYRDPSPSEMNLNTFGALSFGVKYLTDFTYNTGASSLFRTPGGDSNPTPAYYEQARINRQARNLGRSLVNLTALIDRPDGGRPTTDVLFLRGKTGPGAADVTPLPIGFSPDNAVPNTMSEWEANANDPYMRGFVVENLGGRNGGLRGDAIVSWFKPLDRTLDDPADPVDQLYFMVTNGLTGPDGTAADYRQRVRINFLTSVGTSLQTLDPDTGEVRLVDLPFAPGTTTRRQLVVELDGGAGTLFKFNTGHAFIVPEPSAGIAIVAAGAALLVRRRKAAAVPPAAREPTVTG